MEEDDAVTPRGSGWRREIGACPALLKSPEVGWGKRRQQMYEHDDERSDSAGTGGARSGRGGSATLLASQQPAQIHPGATFRTPGAQGVLSTGLPQPGGMAGALVGVASGAEAETTSALLNPLLRRGPSAEKRGASRLLDEALGLARRRGLIESESRTAAMDSTGLETRHVSVHYAKRSWRHRGHYKRRYPKLSALCDIRVT